MNEFRSKVAITISKFLLLYCTLLLAQLGHAQDTPAKLFEAQFRAQVQGDYIYLTKNIQPGLLLKMKTAMVTCLNRIKSDDDLRKLEQAMGVTDIRTLGELEPHLFMAKVLEPQFSSPEAKSMLSVAKLIVDSEEITGERAIVKYRLIFPDKNNEQLSIDKTVTFLKDDGKWYVSANAIMVQKMIAIFESCK